MFDTVVIGLGHNIEKGDDPGVQARLRHIAALYAGQPRVRVTAYTGLTADAARQAGATVLLRGARTAADFDFERNLADVNRTIAGLDTVILPTLPHLAMVSGTVVRELAHYGRDVSQFLPQTTEE